MSQDLEGQREASSYDLLERIEVTLQSGDSTSLHQLVSSRRNEVYELALSLSLKGIEKAITGDYVGAEDLFDGASTLARVFQSVFKEHSLLPLVTRYRTYGLVEKRKKLYADSIIREAERLEKMGKYEKCLKSSQKALKIYQSIQDHKGQADAHRLIGSAKGNLGFHKSAVWHLTQGLELSQRMGDLKLEGESLSSLGLVYSGIGEYRKALECFYKSLSIFREVGDEMKEATALTNLGVLYFNLGQHARALEFYIESLEKQERRGYVLGKVIDLVNIGCAYALDPLRIDSAVHYMELSIPLARKYGFRLYEGTAYLNLGSLLIRKGMFNQALQNLKRGLGIFEDFGATYFEASSHLNMGFALVKLGALVEGERHYLKALDIFSESHRPLKLIETLEQLGWIRELSGKPEEALKYYQDAIEILEETRTNIGIEELKASFVEFKIDVYEEVIRLLYALHSRYPEKGYDRMAFYYSESSRSRSFLDYLVEASGESDEGKEEKQNEEIRRLSKEISSLHFKLLRSDLAEKERKKLEKKLKRCEEALRTLTLQIEGNGVEFAISRPLSLGEIRDQLLDEKTLVLEFFLGHEGAYLFVVSQNGLKFADLGNVSQIEAKLTFFRNLIWDRKRSLEALYLSNHLFRSLLFPAADQISQIENLIVIPDGQLFYLPFEALVTRFSHHQKESLAVSLDTIPFLIRFATITYAPSAAILANLVQYSKDKKEASYDLLLFGDPITKPELEPYRVKRQEEKAKETEVLYPTYFQRLRYSGREAHTISSFFEKKKTRLLLRERAKEEEVKKKEVSQYKVLHFAAHGILNEIDPSGSGILLTQDQDPNEDGFLGLREVLELKLNSDLVTLSACGTGLGCYIRGEGVIGLSRAFIYAGAPSVLVSLWEVDDRSTSLLMGEFYKNLLKGKGKGKALQDAKLSLLSSKNQKLKNPYSWASFVLIGEGSSAIPLSKRGAFDLPLILLVTGGAIVLILFIGARLRSTSR